MVSSLLIAILAPFVFIPLVLAAGRRCRARCAWIALGAPLISFGFFVWLAVQIPSGSHRVLEFPWVPSLGLNLTFLLDGLSLFFGIVVSGMGALVAFYARFYVDDHYEEHGRFYAYLLLFMGAMFGTVLAGNLLLLFICWEMTGVASFLLIGFLHNKENSREGAQMALLVTGGTGLALLAGVVILGTQAGTYDLATLLSGPLVAESRTLVTVAFLLMAAGAMGKSAQFPFHFWLPSAMAAPTPVSAYLHSATMVKLGIFLIARIFPVFNGLELWLPFLVTVGFFTMAAAALLAVLSHDLKAILAYSTITTLGMLIGFYGLGPVAGIRGDLLHITSHVLFKGALFMIAGIIDHSTGSRDIRKLGGLRKRLPWVTILMVVCAASMAGFPGTLGFVSKEYFLQAVVASLPAGGDLARIALVLAVTALTLKVAFSARLIFHTFWGRPNPQANGEFHAPSPGLLLPPTLLAGATLVFGFRPQWLGAWLDDLRVTGLQSGAPLALKAFPDHWALEVALSAGILGAGLLLFLLIGRARWVRFRIPSAVRLDAHFLNALKELPQRAHRLTSALGVDRPLDHLAIVMGFTVLLVGAGFLRDADTLLPALPSLADFHPLRSFVAALIAVAVFMVLALRNWTAQLIAMSIIGFLVTFYFILFRAPDLAMTQILVESATLLLVLLLLSRFPRTANASDSESRSSLRRNLARILISTGLGTMATLISLIALAPKHPDAAGTYYLENTVPLAHGTNAVNTLLVDFRGFDTLFEICVLVIATLGAIGLFMRHRRSQDEYDAGPMSLPGYSTRKRLRVLQEEFPEDRPQ